MVRTKAFHFAEALVEKLTGYLLAASLGFVIRRLLKYFFLCSELVKISMNILD